MIFDVHASTIASFNAVLTRKARNSKVPFMKQGRYSFTSKLVKVSFNFTLCFFFFLLGRKGGGLFHTSSLARKE